MQFRGFSAGNVAYGNPISTDEGATKRSKESKVPNVEFHDPAFFEDFSLPSRANYANIERMLLNLALNHTIMLEVPKENDLHLQEQQEETSGQLLT